VWPVHQAWLTVIESFNGSLKELGDIESWSRSIEEDMRAVSSTLEYTYKVSSLLHYCHGSLLVYIFYIN
jgi:hypothetical protein